MKKPDYCPEWFDLQKYEEYTSRFIRIDWSCNFDSRQRIFQELKGDNPDLEYIRQCITKFPNDLSNYKFNNELESTFDREAIDNAIRPLDFLNTAFYYAACYSLSTKMREHLNFIKKGVDAQFTQGYENQDIFDSLLDYFEYPDEIEETFSELMDKEKVFNRAFLLEDLNYSDEILIEAFKKHLEQIRLKQFQFSNYKQLSASKLKRLSENMILPFIDIYLWNLANGTSLTDRQMANLIYPIRDNTPLDFDAVDRVARTTRPTAMKILNGEYNSAFW